MLFFFPRAVGCISMFMYLGIRQSIPFGSWNMVQNKWSNKAPEQTLGDWQHWELCKHYMRYKNVALGVNTAFLEMIFLAEQGPRELEVNKTVQLVCLFLLALFLSYQELQVNWFTLYLSETKTAPYQWFELNLKLLTLVTALFFSNRKRNIQAVSAQGQVNGGVLHPQKENSHL